MLWVVQETPSTKEGKNTKLSREVSTGWVGFDADCFGLAMKPGLNGGGSVVDDACPSAAQRDRSNSPEICQVTGMR
jgi:hypothetical protein